MHVGVDPSTPVHLVDRVVYSNWVYLATTIANIPATISNARSGYLLVTLMNVAYQVGTLISWSLNARHRYLASRLTYVGVVFAGMVLASAVQGPAMHMEHYLLAIGALGFSMFHPTERRYGAAFAVLSAAAYLVLVTQTEPLLRLAGARTHYAANVLFLNQLTYTVLLLCSLLGIMNAYGRATKLVDEQRAKLFEQSRLSALGSVACNVAHEINTPLMAMDIHIDALETSLEGAPEHAEDRQAVVALGQLSSRIATIVRGFKRLSHSDVADRAEETTLGELVNSSLDVSAGRLKPLGIRIEVDLHAPEQRLRCQIVALSQVLLALIDNSAEAVTELEVDARWIRVESRMRGDRLQLRVTDAGRIASEDVRHRMFEAFFTTKPIGKGTGLGLSLARHTVEQHGGRLEFDPASAHTSFVIELPAVAPVVVQVPVPLANCEAV